MNQKLLAQLSQFSSPVCAQILTLARVKRQLDWDMNTCIPSSWALKRLGEREKENIAFSCIRLLKIIVNCFSLETQQVGKHQDCCLPWVLLMQSKPPTHRVSCFGFVLFPQGWCTNPTGLGGMRRVHWGFYQNVVSPHTHTFSASRQGHSLS